MKRDPSAGLSIAQYAERLRRGEASAYEATDGFLRRIEAENGKLGAYTHVASDQARCDAKEIDARLRSGDDCGPLMGVPVAVKDLYHVDGMPLTAGSQLDVSDIVHSEGPLVRALKSAGAVILGKTWTSEFALGGINFVQRVPWNPCDPDQHRTPGGSSGGSAVALAAGLCAFALGTDTGGSVRMPAALCGVFGHKFSAGAFPLDGIFPLSPTLDSPGLFARTARDAVTVWQTLTGVGARPDRSLNALRFARPTPIFYDDLDSEVVQALEHALERLRRAGACIETIEVPEVREFESLFGRIVPVELLDILGRGRVRAQFERLDPVTQARFSAVLGAPAVDSGLLRDLAALRGRVQRRISDYDAWLTPSAPLVATPLGLYGTVDAALRWNRRALRNTRPGNVFNQCGVSLPLPGTTLPVGLQILCSTGEDSKLLAIASAVEEILSSPE